MGRNATAPYVTVCGNLDRNTRFLTPVVQVTSKTLMDLPLRLDDASASPTTPQGLHREQLI